jgi:histidyl-tRNA synthetase
LRGTKDMYGKEIVKYTQVVDTSRKIASLYGYQEVYTYFKFLLILTCQISTPIIEDANLYLRNLGENSDIVSKEMYIFDDKNNSKIALRPENTAGVVRAYISNNMHSSTSNPMNLFYHGPMFRHER